MKRQSILIVATAVAAALVHAWVARKPAPPAPPHAAFARPAATARQPAKADAIAALNAAAASQERDRQVARAIESAMLSNDAGRRETALTMLLPELLQADPGRVVDLVARQPAGESRDALRDEVARQWIARDAAAAVVWLQTQGDARSSNVAVRALAAISPAQAIDAADRLGVGRDDGSVAHILQIWAAESPREAQRWLDNQRQRP